MFLLWIIAIIAVIGLIQAFDRVRRLEHTTEELRRTIERLTKRLDEGAVTHGVAAAPSAPKPVAARQRPAPPPPPPPTFEEKQEEVEAEELDPALLAGLAWVSSAGTPAETEGPATQLP